MSKRDFIRNKLTLLLSITVIIIWIMTYIAMIYTILGGYELNVKVPLYFVIFPLAAARYFPYNEIIWVLFLFIVISLSGIFILRDFSKYIHKVNYKENFGRFTELFVVLISFTLFSYFVSMLFTQQSNPFGNPTSGVPTNVLLLSLMHAPVWEEIVYRALILGVPLYILFYRGKLPWYRAIVGGKFTMNKPTIALLILSAFFFGSAHLVSWEPAKFPSVFIAGLILGYVFLRYGIYASITMHFLVDFSGSYSLLSGPFWYIAAIFLGYLTFLWFIVGIPYYFTYLGEIFLRKRTKKEENIEKVQENLVLGYKIICPYCGFDQHTYLGENKFKCLRCGSIFYFEKKP